MADDFEARFEAQLLRTGEPRALANPTPVSSSGAAHEPLRGAADAYVAEQGIEHSGGIVERAFEAGARWATHQSAEIVDNYIGGGRSFMMRKIAALSATKEAE